MRPSCTNLFQGDYSHQTADAGDVRVIQAQQREDGVSLPGRERHSERETYTVYIDRDRKRETDRDREKVRQRERRWRGSTRERDRETYTDRD